ncbi:MAG: aminotransferase class III-fold pyridoxal phosphate-dependent enzyme [Paludibacter sp.]|nr:aminotransferase class III-fold pyridoxal phosphate-dependent enzyme [Paludibacter sp.]MDD4198531.1 aminotransferase class III-fold pyridoxal phosphate-dependent enzyme [Paludibacter sp.]MDD4427987.1 aminotransferase class III-fold pyridoxal phosphate-dependent enzyme [Paludibacter sp.]
MKTFDVYPLFNVEIEKGIGCRTYDKQGVEYLDLYGGHAVISVGHSHPFFVQKLTNQVEKLIFYSNSVINKFQEELAEKLGKLSGYDDYSLFLVNSGAEANENALKLASFHNGKKKIIAFEKSFHGRTSAAVKVTDNPKIVAPINDGFEVEFLPLNDIERVKKSLQHQDVCAVIIEGIQGVGGIKIPEVRFLKELSTVCKATGALLILDEIQSGYGRSGKFFAHQYAGIRPDLITVAKGMGNGYPIGGVLISPIFKASHGILGTTFGGNHLACVAAIAVLDIMKAENLINNAQKVGDFLIAELKKLPQIKEVRGLGLMIGLEFDYPVKEIRNKLLFEQKVFTGATGTHIIRLLPPLCLSMNDAKLFIDKLRSVL